ncbi:MAG: LysM peptidoglycan-binding domain-containing protein [bacterium]|nr:LysM peptidoglycan-binding domain-containing protein [bacterium]
MKKLITGLKKPEFWIGIGTTLILLVVLFKSVKPYILKTLSRNNTKNESLVSPIPVETKKIESILISPTMTPTPTPSALAKIKKIADTGTVIVKVKNGDTYWSISKNICGTGVYFETIQRLNNIELHPGDLIQVICE